MLFERFVQNFRGRYRKDSCGQFGHQVTQKLGHLASASVGSASRRKHKGWKRWISLSNCAVVIISMCGRQVPAAPPSARAGSTTPASLLMKRNKYSAAGDGTSGKYKEPRRLARLLHSPNVRVRAAYSLNAAATHEWVTIAYLLRKGHNDGLYSCEKRVGTDSRASCRAARSLVTAPTPENVRSSDRRVLPPRLHIKQHWPLAS